MTTEEQTQMIEAFPEMWAIVELMGHGQTAGRIEKPSEWGGLMRVDVPNEHGTFRTEFYSISAIYSVKFVSEEIARAYAPREKEITAYNTPIVTREQHQQVVNDLRQENYNQTRKIEELQRRLTAIQLLPETTDPDFEQEPDF